MTKRNTKSSSPKSAASTELVSRVRSLRDKLLTGLVERDVPIRLALLAALSGEHLLLVGPPGTAKSLIASRLRYAVGGATYFERLLTRFSVPEELFGPLSIKGLEDDRYERQIDGYLPTAEVAFLDEIFKANSAILNSLLTLLNERKYDNGTERIDTPLVALIGASNELPEGAELRALYDRFLLRAEVGPVTRAGFGELLTLRGESSPDISERDCLSASQLDEVRRNAQGVGVNEDVVHLLTELRDFCIAEGIEVSDRRWRKALKLLQVSAYTNGNDTVTIWDCWLLQHCLWDRPDQRQALCHWFAEQVGATNAFDPQRLTTVVTHWEAQLKKDRSAKAQARDEKGGLLYVSADGSPTANVIEVGPACRGKHLLYLAPPQARLNDRTNNNKGYTEAELGALSWGDSWNRVHFSSWRGRDSYLADGSNRLVLPNELSPHMEPLRHRPEYVNSCLKQLSNDAADIAGYAELLAEHIAGASKTIDEHTWVLSEFGDSALSSLTATKSTVAKLGTRVEKLRKGFEALPQEAPAGPAGAEA